MNSILQMLNAICECPLVDVHTRMRAGFLLWRMRGNAVGFV